MSSPDKITVGLLADLQAENNRLNQVLSQLHEGASHKYCYDDMRLIGMGLGFIVGFIVGGICFYFSVTTPLGG